MVEAHAANGFPADFPRIVASGGPAAGQELTGFGGVPGLTREQQRARLHKRPVVLLHGNGANVSHPTWGLQPLKTMLLRAGYDEAEIWAVSYLGADNASVDLQTPYTGNIEHVRAFIDGVRTYLGVDRVDLIGHSLGAGMGKAYINGLRPDGSYDPALARTDSVGTFVALAGAFYGLGPYGLGEFASGGSYESGSHIFDGITDDTPRGSRSAAEQQGGFEDVTELDDGAVTYVALWAENDFVDAQNRMTGRLMGADLNRGFQLGYGLQGHETIVKSPEVLGVFLPYLDRPAS